MADYTELNPGSGGDKIADETVAQPLNDGTGSLATVHMPRSKIVLGVSGVDDGDVSSSNPLPTTNVEMVALLRVAVELLQKINAKLAKSTGTLP